MIKNALVATLLLAAPSIAVSDDFDPLVGTWVSPDGFARQSLLRTFDNSLIESRMWFQSDSGWRLVAAGAIYRRPGENEWRSISRTIEMDDIELFESTISRTAGTAFRTSNVAYQSDGAVIYTDEEWIFEGEDRFRYTVFKIDDGRRTPWMKGEWVREEESE